MFLALYARASGDLVAAEQSGGNSWRSQRDYGGQKYVVNRRWLATCSTSRAIWPKPNSSFASRCTTRFGSGDQRSVIGNMLKLVAIELDQGNIAGAEATLVECYTARGTSAGPAAIR